MRLLHAAESEETISGGAVLYIQCVSRAAGARGRETQCVYSSSISVGAARDSAFLF